MTFIDIICRSDSKTCNELTHMSLKHLKGGPELGSSRVVSKAYLCRTPFGSSLANTSSCCLVKASMVSHAAPLTSSSLHIAWLSFSWVTINLWSLTAFLLLNDLFLSVLQNECPRIILPPPIIPLKSFAQGCRRIIRNTCTLHQDNEKAAST